MKSTILVYVCSLLACSLLLAGCGGGYVDREGGSFVDTTSSGGFERERAPLTQTPQPLAPIVVNSSSDEFVPPPDETVQGPVPVPYEEAFVGRNAVGAWVRNDRGAQKVFLPDGATLLIERLGVTVTVEMITTGSSGEPVAVFVIDGKRLPSVKKYEQVIDGRVSIYVTDILLK